MRSIEHIKTLLLFAFTFGDVLEGVMEDGKFEWQESFDFIPSMTQLPNIIKSLPEIPKELADLDDEEREQLVTFVREKFDIDNDAIEELIEYSFAFLLETYGRVLGFKERIQALPRKEEPKA